jgi:hypothetical protein
VVNGPRLVQGAENEKGAFLTAKVAAFRHSPRGHDWHRIIELEVYRVYRNKDEETKLVELERDFPKVRPTRTWRELSI